ncbi:MAG TPA: hypothetical protein VJ508_05850, partial [Saprospiraceae bacterium]|nr:hypothetical protein [Saprospiraceae bacterium]
MVIDFVSFSQWWQMMSAAQQVFWFIAIVASVLFCIQIILSIIGYEAHSTDFDTHGDISGSISVEHEFSALSIRSIIAFFMFFGWTGILVLHNQLGVLVAVTFASLAGMAAMFIVAYLMYKFAQLEQSGSLNLYHAIDQEGEVYLSIPAKNSGL